MRTAGLDTFGAIGAGGSISGVVAVTTVGTLVIFLVGMGGLGGQHIVVIAAALVVGRGVGKGAKLVFADVHALPTAAFPGVSLQRVEVIPADVVHKAHMGIAAGEKEVTGFWDISGGLLHQPQEIDLAMDS